MSYVLMNERSPIYWKSAIDLSKVCETPQSSGMPTNSQAKKTLIRLVFCLEDMFKWFRV
jgi:hypothetical protein